MPPICKICKNPASVHTRITMEGKSAECDLCTSCMEKLKQRNCQVDILSYCSSGSAPVRIPAHEKAPSARNKELQKPKKKKPAVAAAAGVFALLLIGIVITVFAVRSHEEKDLNGNADILFASQYLNSEYAPYIRYYTIDKVEPAFDKNHYNVWVTVMLDDTFADSGYDVSIVNRLKTSATDAKRTYEYNYIALDVQGFIYPYNGGKSHPKLTEITDSMKKAMWAKTAEVVSTSLKSPASSKFPEYNDRMISYDRFSVGGLYAKDTYVVSGYVDAANAYGVLLRTGFSLNLKSIGDEFFFLDIDSLVFDD